MSTVCHVLHLPFLQYVKPWNRIIGFAPRIRRVRVHMMLVDGIQVHEVVAVSQSKPGNVWI
jgi:hypothetical protein